MNLRRAPTVLACQYADIARSLISNSMAACDRWLGPSRAQFGQAFRVSLLLFFQVLKNCPQVKVELGCIGFSIRSDFVDNFIAHLHLVLPQQRLNRLPLPQMHFELREYSALEINFFPPGYSCSVPANFLTSLRIPNSF